MLILSRAGPASSFELISGIPCTGVEYADVPYFGLFCKLTRRVGPAGWRSTLFLSGTGLALTFKLVPVLGIPYTGLRCTSVPYIGLLCKFTGRVGPEGGIGEGRRGGVPLEASERASERW